MAETASYVITGASGVLGSAIAKRLNDDWIAAVGLGRRPKPVGFLGEWRECDLTDLASVRTNLHREDVVVHCASSPFTPDQDRVAMTNLITVAKQKDCHIVYTSICGMESAAPYNDYYKAKLEDERAPEASGIHSVSSGLRNSTRL